jgi:hypothetical protein
MVGFNQLVQGGIYRIWPPIGGVPLGMRGITPGGEQMPWGTGPFQFNGYINGGTEGQFTHYDGSIIILKSFDQVGYFPAPASRSRKSRKNRKNNRKSRKNNRR